MYRYRVMQARTLPATLRPTRLVTLAVPILFATAFVLSAFADAAFFLNDLWRSLGIATVLAAGMQILGTAILRSVERGTIAALLALVLIIDPRLALVGVGIVVAVELAGRRGRHIPMLRGVVVAIVAGIFVLSLARTATSADLGSPLPSPQTANQQVHGDPDIHLLLLDGYPRSDTLADEAGYDNGWFEDGLAARGFALSPNSHGNYPFTVQVLASMLHGKHVVDLVDQPPSSSIEQRRQAARLVTSNPAFDRLRERGYGVATVYSRGHLTGWEHQLLSQTALWEPLMEPLLLPDHRSMILDTFDAATDAARTDERVFRLIHVLSPHTPIVFSRDGQLPDDLDYRQRNAFLINREEMGLSRQAFWAAYADQVHYLNGLVLDTVDKILEASPDAVMVIFSDHGARSTRVESDEWYRTFLAARTPGHSHLLANDARAQDIIPALFNAYFGDMIAAPPDVTYITPGGVWMPLTVEERDR